MRKIVVAALAAAAAGCPSPQPGPAPLDVSTPAAYCASIAQTYAARAQGCVGATAAYAGAMAPALAAECNAWMSPAVSGTAVYHAGAARACLDAMATLPCDMLEDHYVAACDGILSGTVAPGGDCASDDECAGGQCEILGGCTGSCAAELAANASCIAAPWMCGSGLTCDRTTWTCVPYAPAALGAACGPGSEPCVSGAYCDATDRCVAKLGAGADCSESAEVCGPGTSCHQELVAMYTIGMCVPWVRAGQGCGTWTGQCVPGTHCDATGTCAADVPNGGACALTEECLGGWCNAGTCAAPRQLGETCVTNEDRACVWGAYCDPLARQCVPWDSCTVL